MLQLPLRSSPSSPSPSSARYSCWELVSEGGTASAVERLGNVLGEPGSAPAVIRGPQANVGPAPQQPCGNIVDRVTGALHVVGAGDHVRGELLDLERRFEHVRHTG